MSRWFIDFDSWCIDADSPGEAERKVRQYIKAGKVPNISNIDINEDEETGDELYNYLQLEVK